MPSSTRLSRLTDTSKQITYLIEIDDVIKRAYDGLVEEFFGYKEFKRYVLQMIEYYSDQMLTFMSYGYGYLRVASKAEFYDIVSDIDTSANTTTDVMKDYILENAMSRFVGFLALELLDQTNVEDYLDKPSFKFVELRSNFITFSYRTKIKVLGFINQNYQD